MRKMFRVINVVLMDVLLMNMAFFLSLYLFKSTDFTWATVVDYASLIVLMTIMKLVVFKYFSLYSSLWEYASIEELMKVVSAVIVSNIIGIVMILMSDLHMYYGIYVVAVVFAIIMVSIAAMVRYAPPIADKFRMSCRRPIVIESRCIRKHLPDQSGDN